MKKIITILLTAFILLACSNTSNSISDGADVLFKSSKTSFTKNDLYNCLKGLNYSDIIISDLVNKVALKENLNMDDYNKEAEELMELYKQMYGMEDFSAYGGDDQFKKQLITDAIINDKAIEYVKTNIDQYVQDDNPFKGQVAYFNNEESAKALIEAVSKGSTFDMAALENGYEYNAQETVYTKDTLSLPDEVVEYLNNCEAGISPVIMTSTNSTDENGKEVLTPVYYVLNVVSNNYNDFLDEYAELKASNVETGEILKNLFEKYNIEFFDQDTIDTLENAYPGVFK